MDETKVIEKIQKLLSLANSDNENEARAATNMANELLLKYNLSLQEIKDHQNEYNVQDMGSTGLTLKKYQKLIASILMEHFFVRCTVTKKHEGYSRNSFRARYTKTIQLVGTKANCLIASYVFAYLNTAFPRLWKDYAKKTESPAYLKNSYFQGVAYGINQMLKETKWKVQNETGLVLKKDPKLEEFMKTVANGTYGSNKEDDIDAQAFAHGVQDGVRVNLKKPLTSTAEQSNKVIESKK